jgi:VWFA-related protein
MISGAMPIRTALPLFALLLLGPLAAHAQDAAAPLSTQDSSTPTLSTRSTLVVVPALVRDKSNQLVYTLKAEDFTLTDDGVPQKIKLEEDTDGEPLALVVAIEDGNGAAHEFGKFDTLAPPLGPMLEAIVGNVPHKVAVVAFDSQPELLQDFTPDLDKAIDSLKNLSPEDHGDSGSAILDAIGFSVDMLRKQPIQYRRAILLISETLDRGSHIKVDDAVRQISDTNTVIYTIGYPSSKTDLSRYSDLRNRPNPPHGCMGKDPDPDAVQSKGGQLYDCAGQLLPPLILARMAAIIIGDHLRRNVPETIAQLTGGEYYKLSKAKDLERSLTSISNHIPNRYVLSFQPQSPHPGLHSLALSLKDYPDLRLIYRSGYWADSTEAAPSAP